MVRHFSLERVQKAPASFDPAKLQAFQTMYMQKVPLDEKVRRVRPFVERAGVVVDDGQLRRIVEALGDRIKVFGDILVQGAYFFGDDVPAWDDKAFTKRVLAPGAVDKLAAYREWLGARDGFDAPSLEAGTQAWLGERGWALGDIVHAVRVATTGVGGGPGLFDCLALLGKERCLRRIDQALAKARG
jgi:glutamyl-tRNA synthetase